MHATKQAARESILPILCACADVEGNIFPFFSLKRFYSTDSFQVKGALTKISKCRSLNQHAMKKESFIWKVSLLIK